MSPHPAHGDAVTAGSKRCLAGSHHHSPPRGVGDTASAGTGGLAGGTCRGAAALPPPQFTALLEPTGSQLCHTTVPCPPRLAGGSLEAEGCVCQDGAVLSGGSGWGCPIWRFVVPLTEPWPAAACLNCMLQCGEAAFAAAACTGMLCRGEEQSSEFSTWELGNTLEPLGWGSGTGAGVSGCREAPARGCCACGAACT